ncbi:hypothetical protein KGQ71_02845 [Patescibacteria group bacterium]|nr:hypothetical protein [Patescibacteria group bacterium]
MTWQKTETVLKRRINQHGLTDMVQAGRICAKAEELYPKLFRAVSVRKNGTLHLELDQKDVLEFKMIEGKLVAALNQFAEKEELPQINRVRLTFIEK